MGQGQWHALPAVTLTMFHVLFTLPVAFITSGFLPLQCARTMKITRTVFYGMMCICKLQPVGHCNNYFSDNSIVPTANGHTEFVVPPFGNLLISPPTPMTSWAFAPADQQVTHNDTLSSSTNQSDIIFPFYIKPCLKASRSSTATATS